MRQLRQEGWIHHLGRHAAACFLTRGGCYVDWERGAEVFEEWLIDHEVACNTGNWQWLSCTAFYSQFFRCYSPIAFPKKTDSKGAFVRHYCPELKDFPDKFIYEPWKTPIADQKKAGCLIQGDGSEAESKGDIKTYPKPMFDFNARRTICIDAIKSAYKMKLYGDNPKVKDGTWREFFPDSAEGPTEGKTEEDATVNGGGKKKRVKSGEEASGDMGVDQDEGEAAEVGGESKGGDHQDRGDGVGKGKRKRGKGKGQETLDGHFGGKKARTKK